MTHIRAASGVCLRQLGCKLTSDPLTQTSSWEVFDAERVSPVYCGENARDSTLSYARQRAGYGRAEIQVLDEAWNVVEMIGNEEARPLV